MTSKLNLISALLILAITIKECQASTTINSGYTNNNFANPTSTNNNSNFNNNNNNELDKYGIVNEVNIVKSPSSSNHPNGKNGDDKEYVTSFYKRVRNKHRCNLFGKVLEECSSNHGSADGVKSGSIGGSESGLGRSVSSDDKQRQSVQSSGYDGIDHSLDHYFDHELRTSSSSTPSSSSTTHDNARYGQQQLAPSSSSRAQAVRGGATRSMVQKPSTFVSETIWAPPRASQRDVRSSRSTVNTSQDYHFENDEYNSSPNLEDDIQDILDGVLEDDGDDSCTASAVHLDEHHHLGLLRVPCSIAVNSGEATHHASSHGTSLKSVLLLSGLVLFLNEHITHLHFSPPTLYLP